MLSTSEWVSSWGVYYRWIWFWFWPGSMTYIANLNGRIYFLFRGGVADEGYLVRGGGGQIIGVQRSVVNVFRWHINPTTTLWSSNARWTNAWVLKDYLFLLSLFFCLYLFFCLSSFSSLLSLHFTPSVNFKLTLYSLGKRKLTSTMFLIPWGGSNLGCSILEDWSIFTLFQWIWCQALSSRKQFETIEIIAINNDITILVNGVGTICFTDDTAHMMPGPIEIYTWEGDIFCGCWGWRMSN